MKYSTETMQKTAQQLSEMIKTAVIEQIETEQRQPTIAQIEQGMRESLHQIAFHQRFAARCFPPAQV
jgi:hypothetical protein